MEEKMNFEGWATILHNDKDIRIYFDEETETQLIQKGFVPADIIDQKDGKRKYILVNPDILRYVIYSISENGK